MSDPVAASAVNGCDIAAVKAAMRVSARARREVLSADERHGAALELARHLSGLALPAGPVAGYWPLGDEMDIRPAMQALRDAGRAAALPVTGPRQTPLTFRLWRAGDHLRKGRFDTRIPPESAPELVPTVILLPLLAFDRSGNRLGYGGGYYDRTLGLLRARGSVLAVGVAYAVQEVPSVPAGRFDRPLDLIVTEAGVIDSGGLPAA